LIGEHKSGGGQQHDTGGHGGEGSEAQRRVGVSGTGAPPNRVITHRRLVVLPAALLGPKTPAYSRNYSAFPGMQGAPRGAGRQRGNGAGAGQWPEGERPPPARRAILASKETICRTTGWPGKFQASATCVSAVPMAVCTPRN